MNELEVGADAGTDRPWYFVSSVLRLFIRPLVTGGGYREAGAVARLLHTVWVTPEPAADVG